MSAARPDGAEGADAYDRVPYTAHAYAEAHPDRLATVARLSGWAAPDVGSGRVLELGCGRGGNLLPMASAYPGASFVGLDASVRQLEDARSCAADAGLKNVTWHAARFEEARTLGGFDFVLCHGLASWIAPGARRALFRTMAGALAPGGVAHASFNVLPGWYERLAARDWLRFARRALPPEGAHGQLAWLRARAAPDRAVYRAALGAVAARVAETDAAYVAHEYLEDAHHPELVGRILDEAAAAGLVYLGDAIPQAVALELLPDDARARADALGAHDAQQLVDFITGAAFRRALFVRAEDAAARGWRWPRRLDPRALEALRVASRLAPEGSDDAPAKGGVTERFVAGDLTVEIADPGAQRALRLLAAAAPASLAWTELVRGAGVGTDGQAELFDAWLATGALALHASSPPLVTTPSTHPRACPVARANARRGGPITNAWHEEVVLPDPLVRAVLALADGTRTADALAQALAGGAAPSADEHAAARASLEVLARLALLVG